jgi:hypothetical protein
LTCPPSTEEGVKFVLDLLVQIVVHLSVVL